MTGQNDRTDVYPKSPGVYPRPDGRWLAQVSAAVAKDRPSRVLNTRDEAIAWREAETARIRMGLSSAQPQSGTVQDHVIAWHARSRNKTSTKKGETVRLQRFIIGQPFGQMLLAAVRPRHIDELVLSTPENYTRVFLINTLSKFFRDAVDNGDILSNPYVSSGADDLRDRIERTHEPKPTVGKTWSLDEVWRFFGAERDPLYYDYWLTVLATGVRKGEAAGFQWLRFHPDEMYLTASVNVTTGAGQVVIEDLPKDWDKRPLYIGPFITKRLEERRIEQAAYRQNFDTWDNREWIFDRRIWKPAHLRRPGEHLDPNNLTRRFHGATDRAGLPRLQGPHGLRHCFAQMARKKGFDEKTIGEMLGHSGPMTRQYTRPTEAEMRELAEWLDATLANLLSG